MKILSFIPVLVLFLFANTAVAQQVIHVKQGANGNGSSWANALGSLQMALKKAKSGDEIWVAAGIYKPTAGFDRNASFRIPSGVAVYGGFVGRETERRQRDWQGQRTILSGEIGTPSFEDNSYSVVVTRNANQNTIVDGFIIRDGFANGEGETTGAHRSGAGWFNDGSNGHSSPAIVNCTFERNRAREGAGLYNFAQNGECRPRIVNCTFTKNMAGLEGGAIFNDGNYGVCTPQIIGCTFDQNESMYGAGIMNEGAHGETRPFVENCTFTRNLSQMKGSSIFSINEEKGTCEVILQACRFSDNRSSLGSGNDISGTVNTLSARGKSQGGIKMSAYR